MKSNRNTWVCTALAIALILSAPSCEDPEKDNPNAAANRALFLVMHTYYLWNEYVPSTVRHAIYPSPVELLDAMMYKELDKWSYISTKQEIEAFYEKASSVGFGIGLGFDSEGTLWITFTYNQSPLREFGVDRGWRILKIDGTTPTPDNLSELIGTRSVGVSKAFDMLAPNNQPVSFTAQMKEIAMNTVLMDTIYSNGTSPIGYFVLQNFVTPTKNELDDVFNRFLAAGVEDLIVDLRYNGGGRMDVAVHLASLIAGYEANGGIFAIYTHNTAIDSMNKAEHITLMPNSLQTNRIVFITSRSSASASEAMVNGLNPHADVTTVGSSTYGKPVGMYSFSYKQFDWVFVPISFTLRNANNEGDYFNGIPADIERRDGVAFPFGDVREDCLNGALAFLGMDVPKTIPSIEMYYPKLSGLQAEKGMW